MFMIIRANGALFYITDAFVSHGRMFCRGYRATGNMPEFLAYDALEHVMP